MIGNIECEPIVVPLPEYLRDNEPDPADSWNRMIDESRSVNRTSTNATRRRSFSPTARAWHMPKPWLEIRPVFRGGKAVTAYPVLTCGRSWTALSKQWAMPTTSGGQITAVASLAAYLLRWHYDLDRRRPRPAPRVPHRRRESLDWMRKNCSRSRPDAPAQKSDALAATDAAGAGADAADDAARRRRGSLRLPAHDRPNVRPSRWAVEAMAAAQADQFEGMFYGRALRTSLSPPHGPVESDDRAREGRCGRKEDRRRCRYWSRGGKKSVNGLDDSGDKATKSILALSKAYIGFATIQSVAMAVGDEFKKAADYVKELASKFIELQKTLQSLASLEGNKIRTSTRKRGGQGGGEFETGRDDRLPHQIHGQGKHVRRRQRDVEDDPGRCR